MSLLSTPTPLRANSLQLRAPDSGKATTDSGSETRSTTIDGSDIDWLSAKDIARGLFCPLCRFQAPCVFCRPAVPHVTGHHISFVATSHKPEQPADALPHAEDQADVVPAEHARSEQGKDQPTQPEAEDAQPNNGFAKLSAELPNAAAQQVIAGLAAAGFQRSVVAHVGRSATGLCGTTRTGAKDLPEELSGAMESMSGELAAFPKSLPRAPSQRDAVVEANIDHILPAILLLIS